jgi:hypothetical protein
MKDGGERMLLLFAPLVWMVALPAVFVVILLIRMLFWLRSLGRPQQGRANRPDTPFIEGEFVDEEPDEPDEPDDPDEPDEPDEPEDGSLPPRNPLEKKP